MSSPRELTQEEKRKREALAWAAEEHARLRAQQEEALKDSRQMDDLFRAAGRNWKSGGDL